MTTAQGHLSVRRKSYGKDGNDGQPGADGKNGIINDYRGEYDSSTEYIYTTSVRQFVSYMGNFYGVYQQGKNVPAGHTPPTNLTDGDNDGYWQKSNDFKFISADTAIIDGGNIGGFSFSRKKKSDGTDKKVNGNIVGVLQSQNVDETGEPMLSMDSETGELRASKANIRGTLTSGNVNGKRVVIDPDSECVSIYDENNKEVAVLDGTTYKTLSDLFSGEQSGNVTFNSNNNTSVTASSDTVINKSDTVNISNVFYTSAVVRLEVKGDISAKSTAIYSKDIIDSSNASYAFSVLRMYAKTYSDESLTMLVESKEIGSISAYANQDTEGETSSTAIAQSVTMQAGYHVIEATYSLRTTNGGAKAMCEWSMDSGVYTSDFYVSRYFAGGFCLGSSSKNFVSIINQNDDELHMKALTMDYGLDVSKNGIQTLHHGGVWANMPMLVYKGQLKYTSGTAYTLTSYYTFASGTPSHSRSESGNNIYIKVTLPAEWNSLLGITSAADMEKKLIIHAEGYNTANIKCNIGNIIYSNTGSSFCIYVADDAKGNDSSVLFDIWCI